LDHLLFTAYVFLFAYLVTKVRFFIKSGLSPALLITLFLLKITVGMIYGWIGVFYNQKDTWAFHKNGLEEKKQLLSDPLEFLFSFFRSGYTENKYGKFLSVENSWWNDLDANFFNKMIAVFNVFSFDNYYINVVFYSFITLAGPIAIYRVMANIFPSKRLPVLLSTFLLPSLIYWTSGIHKEGFIFTCLALLIYCFYNGFLQKKFPSRYLAVIAISLTVMLVLRNFLVLFLIPGLIAWILAEKLRWKPVLTFSTVYLFFTILFFSSKYIHPAFNFPQSVVDRQQAFLALKGGSAVAVRPLEPLVGSFIHNVPQVVSMSAIRPHITDVKHILSLAAAIEINLLLCLFLVFLKWRQPSITRSPILLFFVFFAFSVLMSIGYTVHFLGAIVRYRSIVLPLLIIPMMASINWKKIEEFLFTDITIDKNI
jgi:hypothetical protein